ncbi:nudC domain-containing protein 3-like protein [Dinothrombium tinctorium]|uniref:NudC domain-containing protein 3-like protein n=1 Tax=Dinothrombium tinctorium TaxID=1965070 RepID=A0A3S3Q1X3_9ACAR|nr:nudC domain-containing protein 3-like protein [Dinothrombium tinctorium]
MSSEELLREALAKEHHSTVAFLDAAFRMLRESSDFYSCSDNRAIVMKLMEKYASQQSVSGDKPKPLPKAANRVESNLEALPCAVHSTSRAVPSTPKASSVRSSSSSLSNRVSINELIINQHDNYNGASCQNYSWSQTLTEIDVMVKIPETVTSSNHVRVFIRPTDLTVVVNVGGNWVYKVNGRLCYPIRTANSVWTLHPGSHIHISLEKERDRWWNVLISGEEQIDVGKVDRSVRLEDLTEEAQAIVKKLAYEEYVKNKLRFPQQ